MCVILSFAGVTLMTVGVIQQKEEIQELTKEEKRDKALYAYGYLQVFILLCIPILTTINNLFNRVLRDLHENTIVTYIQISLFIFTGTSIVLSESLDFGYIKSLNL